MGILSKKDENGTDEMSLDFHFPTSKKALIIFIRNPELGKCKTRLAATIGNESALSVYKYLLQHTATISTKVNTDRYVFYSETIKKEDIWSDGSFRKKLQHGEDLGERMHNAFSELFYIGYEKIIIIGSDLLDLDAEIINEAFKKLDEHDLVIGPAKDGGYFLLGANTLHEEIFKNKAWGTSTVLQETMRNLKKYDVHLLNELNDIDTFEDMQHYTELKRFYTKP